jgi:hypothetical protein
MDSAVTSQHVLATLSLTPKVDVIHVHHSAWCKMIVLDVVNRVYQLHAHEIRLLLKQGVNHAKNVPESLPINEVAFNQHVEVTKLYTEMASAKHAKLSPLLDKDHKDNADSVRGLHVPQCKFFLLQDNANHAHPAQLYHLMEGAVTKQPVQATLSSTHEVHVTHVNHSVL